MLLYGKLGVSLKHDTAQPKQHATYSSRVFGHALNLVEVRVVDGVVPVFGRLGELWKHKRVIILQLGDVLAEH